MVRQAHHERIKGSYFFTMSLIEFNVLLQSSYTFNNFVIIFAKFLEHKK